MKNRDYSGTYNDGSYRDESNGGGAAKALVKPSAWRLFLSFFKIGLFTFGGGYAMLPLIEREVVAEQRWVTQEEYLEGLTVSEGIPGAIAVKQAVTIGLKCGGYLGALASTLGVTLPSFLVILIIAMFFDGFQEIAAVNNFIEGVKPVVIGLILSAAFSLGARMIKTRSVAIIAAVAFVAVVLLKLNPMLVMAVSAAAHTAWSVYHAKRA